MTTRNPAPHTLRLGGTSLLAALALSLSACGGDTKTVTVAAAAPATTTTEAPTATTPATTTTEAAAPTSCEDLDIVAGGKEGACIDEEGWKVRVVDRDTTLALNDLTVRLGSITQADTLTIIDDVQRPDGVFVKVDLTVKNRLDSPLSLDTEKFLLLVDGKSFTPDFDAMNGLDGSFVTNDDAIQPDTARSGSIVFDVSKKAAKALEGSDGGNVVVFQPTDEIDATSEGDRPTQRVGYIRTYQ